MSRIDRECFPDFLRDDRPVCAKCFDDTDLNQMIRRHDGLPGCSFCDQDDAPTIPFGLVAGYIKLTILKYYSRAIDELPHDGGEGGYQAWNIDTYDLIRSELGLELPRNANNHLFREIVDYIGDEIWCKYDWLVLDPDASLRFSWDEFCEIVKHQRRYFFHNKGSEDAFHPDLRSPLQLLTEVCRLVEKQNLIRTEAAGYTLYRARPRTEVAERHTTPASLGPPPQNVIQSNRMNPPGIPMFYGADLISLAVAETRNTIVSIGRFEALRPLRILDLANLPPVAGLFSDAERVDRLKLSFLRQFASIILQPVPRDDRVHIDYIPTQIFTEFLRDFDFEDGPIDGLRYRSATGEEGTNVVLFAGPSDVEGAVEPSKYGASPRPLLRLVDVEHRG